MDFYENRETHRNSNLKGIGGTLVRSPSAKNFLKGKNRGDIISWIRKEFCLSTPGQSVNADRHCETFRKLRRVTQKSDKGMMTLSPTPHAKRLPLVGVFWTMASPDLTPSDYFLFSVLKEHMGGTWRRGKECRVWMAGTCVRNRKVDTPAHQVLEPNGDYVEKYWYTCLMCHTGFVKKYTFCKML